MLDGLDESRAWGCITEASTIRATRRFVTSNFARFQAILETLEPSKESAVVAIIIRASVLLGENGTIGIPACRRRLRPLGNS